MTVKGGRGRYRGKKWRREGSKKKGEKRGVERWKGRVRERGEIYEERKEKKKKRRRTKKDRRKKATRRKA